jgi:hypothetical protein
MTPAAASAGEQVSPSGQSCLLRQMVQSVGAPQAKQGERRWLTLAERALQIAAKVVR